MAVTLPDTVVRRIGADEWSLLRDLRLRSLADAPEAFGQSLGEARAKPEAEWQAAARASAAGDARAWFVAKSGASTMGIVQARRRPPHAVLIFSMWVDPRARRAGIGTRLIEAAELWAQSWGATHSVLWVFSANDNGQRFYERLGYVVEHDGPDADAGVEYGALAMRRPVG